MILGQKRTFMPLYIAKSGDLDRCYRCLTDSLTHSHLKDSATQLLIKCKSGALVTQHHHYCRHPHHHHDSNQPQSTSLLLEALPSVSGEDFHVVMIGGW